MKIKNLHLIVSILIIIPVGLVYGFNVGGVLSNTFLFTTDNVNLSNMLKAVMGLYLSLSLFWFIAILKPHLWATATLVNILFMSGLAFGRIISLLIDGIPSYLFLLGLGGEVLLALWGVINLSVYRKRSELPTRRRDKL